MILESYFGNIHILNIQFILVFLLVFYITCPFIVFASWVGVHAGEISHMLARGRAPKLTSENKTATGEKTHKRTSSLIAPTASSTHVRLVKTLLSSLHRQMNEFQTQFRNFAGAPHVCAECIIKASKCNFIFKNTWRIFGM